MPKTVPYDELSTDTKETLANYAAHWLSLKPELVGVVKTDEELVKRLITFAKIIHEYFPQKKIKEEEESL
jgi:hypothetical protein